MLFQTTKFLLFFFIFYILFLYFKENRNKRLSILLIASYVFYGHWDWRFLSLIIASTLVDYYLGYKIEDSANETSRKRMLTLSVIFNLTFLGIFKYFNFFVDSFLEVTKYAGLSFSDPLIQVILPVGISFYTFESISYIIDIYRKKIRACRSPIEYAVFISFFPHLVAGPIIRPKIFFAQVNLVPEVTKDIFYAGGARFAIGVFKKIWLSDIIASNFVDLVFENPMAYSSLDCVIAAVGYSFQIYLDFSAYTDMAIGLSMMCGIYLPENFNYPYMAKNFKDFWERWHISLSTWLKDYLYIPLGGNRFGRFHKYKNVMITMLLGGLWHGANVTFVIWGFIHGILISLYHLLNDYSLLVGFRRRMGSFLSVLLTFSLVTIAWIFFRCATWADSKIFITKIFKFDFSLENSQCPPSILLIILLCYLIHYLGYRGYKQKLIDYITHSQWWIRVAVFLIMVITIIIGQQNFQPFIYFQF